MDEEKEKYEIKEVRAIKKMKRVDISDMNLPDIKEGSDWSDIEFELKKHGVMCFVVSW